MEGVGTQLDKAKESYKIAMDQFTHGKGNLIQQVNDFERLGVAVQGKFSENLVAKAGLELEFLSELPAQENVPLE